MPHGCRTGAKTRLCPKCKSYYKPVEPSDPCPGCGLPGDEHEAYTERKKAEVEEWRRKAMTRPVDARFYSLTELRDKLRGEEEESSDE